MNSIELFRFDINSPPATEKEWYERWVGEIVNVYRINGDSINDFILREANSDHILLNTYNGTGTAKIYYDNIEAIVVRLGEAELNRLIN